MPLHARTVFGSESWSANAFGVLVTELNFPLESWNSHVNSSLGEGGGPSIKVRIRWISRSIFSLAAPMSSEDAVSDEESARRRRASSRRSDVIRESIALEFMALKESGYKLWGTSPYLRTMFAAISHCPPSLTGPAMSACKRRPSSGSFAVSKMFSRK